MSELFCTRTGCHLHAQCFLSDRQRRDLRLDQHVGYVHAVCVRASFSAKHPHLTFDLSINRPAVLCSRSGMFPDKCYDGCLPCDTGAALFLAYGVTGDSTSFQSHSLGVFSSRIGTCDGRDRAQARLLHTTQVPGASY